MPLIIDQQARQQAISPQHSYVVQAPAGSGKTELLIQRILALLAVVDEPEEILALTFTRKAAAEMRERVCKALLLAQQEQPQEKHAQTTWDLAKQVLRQSEAQGWRLLDYPARLRIMTIDSFASGLARQLPILSGFGQSPTTANHAEPMYQHAVDAILSYAQQKNAPQELQQAVNTLILHQECKLDKLQQLLCNMLTRREQWLPDVLRHSLDMGSFRLHIESCLQLVIEHSLSEAYQALPADFKGGIPALARFAEEQLSLNSDEHVLSSIKGIQRFPTADMACLEQWKALIHLALTKNDPKLRARLTAKEGFPPAKDCKEAKEQKEKLLALLSCLEGNTTLLHQLHHIRCLPNQAQFDDTSWHVLEALFLVLKMLAGQLWHTFEQHKQVDFVEVMLRAKQALGQENNVGEMIPSEALLRLDYQIKHILLDEFQDTSTLQIDLLSRLTAGWLDDGRSLFMVGDPMQSIYRFRKAEVRLFLKATKNELPEHQKLPFVTSLKLQQNFRSSPDIVHWVNRAFSCISPDKNDALAGAIAYAPSEAFKSDQGKVCLHILKQRNDEQEAALILDVIRQARTQDKSIGILARSRSHLKVIMQLLQQENLPFRALDMLALAKQPEIIDLRSLTSALLHPCDSIAWASLLRAPTVGLSLDCLHRIFSPQAASAWQAIQDYANITNDHEEQTRLQTFIQAIAPAIAQHKRIGLRTCLESTWLRLASPAILSKSQLANTDVYFQLIEQLEDEASLDINTLDQRLAKLYAKPETQANAEHIELMTMHGSKGLQWDTVILPGLGKPPRPKDKDVLVQTEVSTNQGQQLLLSPLPQHKNHEEPTKIYNLIRDFEKQRDDLEIARLLYVACTRAESSLHLFGHVQGKEDLPQSSSLLSLLWQDDETCFDAQIILHQSEEQDMQDAQNTPPSPMIAPQAQCIDVDFKPSAPQASILSSGSKQQLNSPQHQPVFSWAGASAKAVGIALHAALQQLGEVGIENMSSKQQQHIQSTMQAQLLKEGISQAHLSQTLARCQKGLNICLQSDKARWILSDKHQAQHNEWALTYIDNSICKHIILDRSFIDQDGTRWIIDYKTGGHEGAGLDAFLDQELLRYTQETPQLPNYVKALQALEPERTIKAALYFPMVDGWRVWEA